MVARSIDHHLPDLALQRRGRLHNCLDDQASAHHLVVITDVGYRSRLDLRSSVSLHGSIERLTPVRARIRDTVFPDTSAFLHRPPTTSRIPFRGWETLDDHQR